jgi:molybdate transport system ATP-binding protein
LVAVSRLLEVEIERVFPCGARVEAALSVDFAGAPVLALFGPSGAGKTTVLRCLAGLDRPRKGRIRFGGQTWFDSARGINVPPQGRGIGWAPQEQALFPHLTVRGNVGYGGAPRAAVDAALEQTGATGFAERKPAQISGGQRQRAALARALARTPALLLLDEPLSSLDDAGREDVRDDLRRVVRSTGTPTIVVTHDRDEALQLADLAAVIADGRVRQVGPIDEVFSRPADPAAAAVVGMESIVAGRILGTRDGLSTVEVGAAQLTAVNEAGLEGDVTVCIRAVDVVLARDAAPDSARNKLRGTVTAVRPGAVLQRVELDCGFRLAAMVTARSLKEMEIRPGAPLIASVKAPSVHLIPRLDRA